VISHDLSVIIPFKDKSKMTLDAVRSLLRFGPPVKEILLISNNSSDSELEAIREGIVTIPSAKVLEYNHPFNYQKINNWAVKQSSGKFILFLNNDTELVSKSRGTLEHMYELASKKDVGMVGCVLLYGDERTIQHAGVYLRPGSLGDHIYVGKIYKSALERKDLNEFPYSVTGDRKLTATTGAVQIIEREKFDAINGMDERFIIGGGDVDLCIRLNKAGYQTYIAGKGYILHKESQSRSHLPIKFSDFYYSYLSYITAFDLQVGDPFSPEITKEMT
jgi:GT2 family glycosyltransferase